MPAVAIYEYAPLVSSVPVRSPGLVASQFGVTLALCRSQHVVGEEMVFEMRASERCLRGADRMRGRGEDGRRDGPVGKLFVQAGLLRDQRLAEWNGLGLHGGE